MSATLIEQSVADLGWFDENEWQALGMGRPSVEYTDPHNYPLSVPTWFPSAKKEFYDSLTALDSKGVKGFHTYLHLPFCMRSCEFCAFYREISVKAGVVDSYISKLLAEVGRVSSLLGKIKIQSIYMGGGTPSFLSADQLDRLLNGLFHQAEVLPAGMFCSEVSPETVTQEKLTVLKKYGFNRISMGVQSMDEAILKHAHRPHNKKQVFRAAEAIHGAGFSEFNVDLIHGLPGQSLDSWHLTLRDLARLSPDAFTAYYYRRIPGTGYAASLSPDNAGDWKQRLVMRRMAMLTARDIGYVQVRSHYYCRPENVRKRYRTSPLQDGKQASRILGFGTSARSLISNVFFINAAQLQSYVNGTQNEFGRVAKYELSPADQVCRTVIQNLIGYLRMDKRAFMNEHHSPAEHFYKKEWGLLLEKELIKDTGGAYVLTERGILLNDEVSRLLYPKSMKTRFNELSSKNVPLTEVLKLAR